MELKNCRNCKYLENSRFGLMCSKELEEDIYRIDNECEGWETYDINESNEPNLTLKDIDIDKLMVDISDETKLNDGIDIEDDANATLIKQIVRYIKNTYKVYLNYDNEEDDTDMILVDDIEDEIKKRSFGFSADEVSAYAFIHNGKIRYILDGVN